MKMLWVLLLAIAALADIRPVPPPGVAISAADRAELEAGLERLGRSIEKLQGDLVPDVEIFHKAVRYAVQHNEFFKVDEVARAKELLKQGQARADALARGEAPWATATGLVVRGYFSKIDRSVQPYGLVIPPAYSPNLPHRWRLDAWFHGRSETLSELNFLFDRQRNPGEFTPANTIVVHLYGRYCNANKLAGEVDLFETLAAVKRQYAIDENRIVIRGFSMGGAAAWHFAAHYAGEWAAAAPGAGFSETPDFLRVFQKETVEPTWWEKKLWHLYDATDYALNLYNCPTVAYSGEIDVQKQAADIMARALEAEGMQLTHVIGPKTAHRYHPEAKVTINRLIDQIAERGRDPYPRKVKFTTWTLAYNKMKWITVDALEKHWERARIEAEIVDDHTVTARTSNIDAFTFDIGPGGGALDPTQRPAVTIDGQKLIASSPETDRAWRAHFRKTAGKWSAAHDAADSGLRKRHGLQGPIDDAFLDSFVIVRPTGQSLQPGTDSWVKSEMSRAIREWRRQFRGDAQAVDDTQVTDALIAQSNLVLWGDPGSNKLLARIADRLPIRWAGDGITLAGKRYEPANHVLILIYPNPLNPDKYVVLNSGFTFREYDNLNNARQVPKLPDFAIVDVSTPANERYPGRVAAAGFFGEKWELGETKMSRLSLR